MNMYEVLDSNGNAVAGPFSYAEAMRYMQRNRLDRNEYSIVLYMPTRSRNVEDSMTTEQALVITVNAIRTDALLTGEAVNLNRVTFWLSELSYGRKWFGDSMSRTVARDIVQTAASIAETEVGPARLVELASA